MGVMGIMGIMGIMGFMGDVGWTVPTLLRCGVGGQWSMRTAALTNPSGR